jgi:hypothetical protein
MKLTVNPEEIAGTIFAEIFQITTEEIGNARIGLSSLSVTGRDKVEGTLSEFEKKIFATIFKKRSKLENLIPNPDGTEDFELLGFEPEALQEDIDLLTNMMFLVVRRRLNFQGPQISIKKDFQLTSPKPVEIEGHDCANCSRKDDCPLQSGELLGFFNLLNEFAGIGFLNDEEE